MDFKGVLKHEAYRVWQTRLLVHKKYVYYLNLIQQIDLTLYDPESSSTSKLVNCDEDFCTATYDGQLPGCKPNLQCQYNVVYGDGSSTAGYFVKDTLHFDKVTGNHQTATTNGTVIFG